MRRDAARCFLIYRTTQIVTGPIKPEGCNGSSFE